MWPWEHIALGYVAYSLLARSRRRLPGGAESLAVGFGALFPDLLDKPLGWVFGLTASGRSVGHSLLFVVPLCLVVYLLARRRSRGPAGIAFGVGVLSHLPADALYPIVRGDGPALLFLLWPVRADAGGGREPVFAYVGELFEAYLGALAGPRGPLYLALELVVVGGAIALWMRDGRPGLG
jgi:hypothetical protein